LVLPWYTRKLIRFGYICQNPFKMQNALFVVAGLVLLIAGGNWLLKAAVDLSLKLHIPKIVIGMTVVSFATSAQSSL
jgi:Ca2+/Na+ antiporter